LLDPELTVTVPAFLTEGVRPKPDAGLVSIPRTRIGSLTVDLNSSDTSEVRVPRNVIIPAGQTSATFDLDVMDDALRDGTQLAYITATALGCEPGLTRILIHDNESMTLSVSLPPDATEGNTNVVGRVSTSAAVPVWSVCR